MMTLLLALILAAPVQTVTPTTAQTFHVTEVRDWTPADPAPVSRVKVYVITGTIGNIRYVTQQLFTIGSQHFVVGSDYPVTVAGQALKVQMTDKRGHNIPERLDVTGTTETR